MRERPAAVVGLGCVVLSTALAVPALLDAERSSARRARSAAAAPQVEGYPVFPWFGQDRTRFLAQVRSIVPRSAEVRIVMPSGPGGDGICGHTTSRGRYWWAVYQLVPRTSTCDPHAAWSIYLGVSAPATASGESVVVSGPAYALVHRTAP